MFYRSSPGISRKGGVNLNGNGTDTFRAPEVELYNRNPGTTVPTLTSKVDVYAFAMIMYILLYGNRLWHLGPGTRTQRSRRGLIADKKCNRPPLGDSTVLGRKTPVFTPHETIENWKIGGLSDNFVPTRCSRKYKAWNENENAWVDTTTDTAPSVEYMTPHTKRYIKLM